MKRGGRPVPRTTLRVQELEDRVVPTLIGQQLFPLNNPWNQNISNAPVAANSASIISHIGTSIRLHPDWGADNPANGDDPLYGIPVNIVHGNSTAKVNVTIDNYPGESDITPVPIPANAVIEGDYQNGPNPNGGGYNYGQRGDSHLIIWDEDTNIAYELYGVTRPTDTTLFPNTNGDELPHTDGLWHAAQETVWNMNTNTFRTLGETSADAAGLSILAGLVRPDEGLPVSQGGQGAIDHALRVTLPSGDVNPQYIYPASHMVSTSQGANNLPLGGRLRLANTPAIDTLISNMPPESQIIAMRHAAIRPDRRGHRQRHVCHRLLRHRGHRRLAQSRPDLEPERHLRLERPRGAERRRLPGGQLDPRGDRPQRDQRFRRQHRHDHRPELLGRGRPPLGVLRHHRRQLGHRRERFADHRGCPQLVQAP